jgi:hypothetical protein
LGFALYGTKERGEERRGEERREERREEKRRDEKRGGLAITFHCNTIRKNLKEKKGELYYLVSDEDDDDDDDNGVFGSFSFFLANPKKKTNSSLWLCL